MSEGAPGVRHSELHARIGRALVESAPPGWSEIRLTYRSAGKSAESIFCAVMSDGTMSHGWPIGIDFDMAFNSLRKAMYQTDKGTWYSALCTIDSQGNMRFDFDYDSEPEWSTERSPSTYVEDLELFPRSQENQPPWLKDVISKIRR